MNELAKVFEENCEQVYGSCNTTNYIEDEFVAIIQIKKNGINFEFEFEKNIIYNNKGKRDSQTVKYIENEKLEIIAIILESPHRDEYDNGKPLGPAIGQTGQNIANHLLEVFNTKTIIDILNNSKEIIGNLEQNNIVRFKVLLVEAIGFQCSNGLKKINEEKRNDVFNFVWNRGGRQHLEKRLKEYQPIIIINSATGGSKNIDNNDAINGKIQKLLNSMNFISCHSAHPCSTWFWRKGLIESNK